MAGNVAIVTGYSSGLGKEFASQLLEAGWSVVGVSRQTEPEDLHDTHGDKLTAVHGSVSEQGTAEAAFAAAEALGGASVLVNSAGVGVFGDIGGYSADDIARVLAGNLAGLMLFSDMAVTRLRGSGEIVNVMSTAGKKLRPAESIYVAAKWGAKAYTRTLREALKSAKSPIRVFEVYPCGMDTRFWSTATRPVADGSAFPKPAEIAQTVLAEVLRRGSAYVQEFTFERG